MNSAIFWGEKKETSRISPSSLLSPTSCCWYLLWMWPSPVQIPSWPLSEWVLGQSITGSSSSKVAGSFFWGGSVWTRVCWGLRGFAPLPTGRMQASCRPCSHANSSPGALSAPICADICGSFISPLASVLQKWAPEHVFYEKLSLLTLFSNESCFLIRDFSPVLSRRCCSKPLAVKHFKHGETAISYGYCGTLLRQGWVSFWGDAQRK